MRGKITGSTVRQIPSSSLSELALTVQFFDDDARVFDLIQSAGVDSNPIVQVQQRQANSQHAADVALAQFGLKNDAARDASLNAIESEAARRLEQADNAREGVAAA